ncbi:Protein Y95B8A.12 b [Aphelenchoides avenae]|nr:Protein Y95B8A.12 b [Aphelenchus avenae]
MSMADASQLTLFHHLRGNSLIKQADDAEVQTIHPNREQLLRRDAIVPEEPVNETEKQNGDSNVIIVPHVQITSNDTQLFNRAVSSGGGLLADLQRATMATQAFYADENPKTRSPWILRRLYEWSHRAKSREVVKHAVRALDASPARDREDEDEQLAQLMEVNWEDMFPNPNSTLEENDKKRLQAVWELFHSELVFLHKQLLVLRNVYKEPLKKCQVEGVLLNVEPELLFGNLDQLCRISRRFCQSFLVLIKEVTDRGPESRYETTDFAVRLFEKFSKGPSTISAYQAYCINYKATIEYLGSVRQKEERFVEFERVCVSDTRSGRLQLEDLLIAPLQRITRLPILLKEILKFTESMEDKAKLEKVLETMNENLRSIDDSVQWLHNFERLQQLQTLVIWPAVTEMEPRTYIPDFLKGALSRQFCENLLAHPRRKLVHEGPLEYVENGRITDCYAFLFNDMFLITKPRKVATKTKKANSNTASKQEYYAVHKQPVPLDSCVFCDADSSEDTHQNTALKNAFVVIHLTRYYQVVSVYTFQTPNKADKEVWIEKFQESIENYESIQLKDMLRCTPLFSSLSLRRSSSSRYSCSSSRQRSLH